MSRVVVGVFGSSSGPEIKLLTPLIRPRPLKPTAKLEVTTSTQTIQDLRTNKRPTPDIVSNAGDELMKALNSQDDVKDALTTMLRASTLYPLYLQFGTGANEAERLPWEALHDRSGAKPRFLALGDLLPIVRQAEYCLSQPVYRGPERGQGSSPPLLKVLAVIAPPKANSYDAKSQHEWDALHAALDHLAAKKNPGIGIEFRVMAADTALQQHIRSVAPEVTVVMIPDKRAVLDEIKNYQPQILHIFTHGSTSGGSHLQLAHTYDIQESQGAANITIEPEDILAEVRSISVPMWLTVLNCCETGVGVDQGFSFAFELISPDIPAALGMAERIDAAECHAFTKALYPELIDLAERNLPQAGTPYTVVEWASLLWRPRRSVCESITRGSASYADAMSHKQWTFPILYVLPDEFRLQRPIPSPDQEAQRETVSQAEAQFRGTPGMPREVINNVRHELQAILPSPEP
jgi:hypothetical protein